MSELRFMCMFYMYDKWILHVSKEELECTCTGIYMYRYLHVVYTIYIYLYIYIYIYIYEKSMKIPKE